MYRIELQKLLSSRYTMVLFAATVILFPTIVAFTSHAHATHDNVPEGLFVHHVAYAILVYIQSYFFVPIWIIFLTGREFSIGHATRVCVLKSRSYYFQSKLTFCTIVTILFTALGLIAFVLSIEVVPLEVSVSPLFLTILCAQIAVSTFALAIFLMFITFLFRSATIAFVFYVCYGLIETTLYTVCLKLFDADLLFLPLIFARSVFSTSGFSSVDNYCQPQDITPFLLVMAFTIVVAACTRLIFARKDLPMLSD